MSLPKIGGLHILDAGVQSTPSYPITVETTFLFMTDPATFFTQLSLN